MRHVKLLILHVNVLNSFIEDMFSDPKWKENMDAHFNIIKEVQESIKGDISRIRFDQPPRVDKSPSQHSRYIPGKKEFAMKYKTTLLKRSGYRWREYYRMAEVKAMLADVRATLSYNPRTCDSDICTFLINSLSK